MRPLLAAKGFNTNLVHFLAPYYVIVSNLHICPFMGMTSHVYRRAPKTILFLQSLVYKKYNLWRSDSPQLPGNFIFCSPHCILLFKYHLLSGFVNPFNSMLMLNAGISYSLPRFCCSFSIRRLFPLTLTYHQDFWIILPD